MKKKINHIVTMLFLLTLVGSLGSCNKDRTELDMEKAVEITQFTIDGRNGIIDQESATILIKMPAGTTLLSDLTPQLSVSAGASIRPASGEAIDLTNPVDYFVSSGNVYKKYRVSAEVLAAKILSFSINGVSGIIDEAALTITIPLPYGTNLTALTPTIALAEENSISPASGTSLDFSSPVVFTLTSGTLSVQYTVSTSIAVTPDVSKGPIGNKIAFLGTSASVQTLPDDDELAAATWFFNEFPEAEYISWTQVMAGLVNIYHYKTIWWHYDAALELPYEATHEAVKGIFGDYMKDGGNLFFSGHACQYFWSIGRLNRSYNMAIGTGGGFENGDTWTIGVNLPGVDNRNHPIYQGLTFDESDGFFTFPVIGPGYREDHNHVIVEVAANHGYPNNHPGAYVAFTETNSVAWLGVWGGIRDYYMAGVLELLPNETFKGKGIYIGIGGIEWNQNEQGTINPAGINAYQENIQLMARNSINYLSGNK
ncbi:MAG: putative lipoprotein [Bacteroidetes bacterium]|nr:MAG: putative lipoprotein [Bacteroidota bacterium]